jgi:hypothetical protein
MTIQALNKSYKGVSQISLTRLDDNVTFAFPSPETFSISSNIEEKIQMTRNEFGEKVRGGTFKMGEMPELSISYGYVQPEMIAFRLGQRLAEGTVDTEIPRQVIAADSIPADATGGLYFGIAADPATAIASIIVDSISVPLTRQPFATFAPATPLSYAVGANGALLFSTDLVAAKESVTLVLPITGATVASISDLLVGPLAIKAKLVDSTNGVTLISIPNATVNLSGANFSFGSDENSEIGFYVNSTPGACRSWDLYVLSGVTVQC